MKKLCILLCLCLLLSGCTTNVEEHTPTGDGLSYGDDYTGPQNKPDTQEKPQHFSLAYYKDLPLNPYLSTDFTNRALLPLLYQSLFTTNRNYVVEPQLCKSFTVSKDMKTYTFYLEQATFSDGSVLTPEDVVASLNAARQSQFYTGRFLHVKKVMLSGDGGVTVTLDTPYENLPLLLDVPIVQAAQVALDRPTGTGPYVLYTAIGGESLRRRTDWWCNAEMAVTADTITLLPAESATHIRDQFEFSDLSVACADPGSDRYADYRCDYELWDCENGIFLYLGTAENSKVFSNDAVRIALTHAVNREALVKEFYRGFARSATLPASPLFPYYNQNLAERYEYDSTKFAEAVQNANMVGQTVVFLANRDDSLRLRVARSIAAMLEAGGLKVQMKELGGNAYLNALKNWEYDIYLGQTRLSPTMNLSAFFSAYGNLSLGGMDDVAAYSLSLQALENHGNYFSLHKLVMDKGLLCPVLFRSYAIYARRGVASELTPARENVFYYSLGKTMESAQKS